VRIGTNPENITVSKAALASLLRMIRTGKRTAAVDAIRCILAEHHQENDERDGWLARLIAADERRESAVRAADAAALALHDVLSEVRP